MGKKSVDTTLITESRTWGKAWRFSAYLLQAVFASVTHAHTEAHQCYTQRACQ